MFWRGTWNPAARSAHLTRKRASTTEASGLPTTVIPGRPDEMLTSTCTGRASIPRSIAVVTMNAAGIYPSQAQTPT